MIDNWRIHAVVLCSRALWSRFVRVVVMLNVVDSAGYSWEDVKPPSPSPPPSGENAHLIPPDPVAVRLVHCIYRYLSSSMAWECDGTLTRYFPCLVSHCIYFVHCTTFPHLRQVYCASSCEQFTENVSQKYVLSIAATVSLTAFNATHCLHVNPRRACAARVTVLGVCVCLSVCPSLFSQYRQRRSL